MSTTSRNRRNGRFIWEWQRGRGVAHAPLRRDVEADVLVIGAGITGAMIADAVVESGLSVVMVDRRGAALVQYKIDTPLIYLARKIGKANAVRAWRRSRLAVDAIAARLLGVQKPPALSTQALSCGGREPPTMT